MAKLELGLRNLYPNPSHEYGLPPLPNTPDTGPTSGTITLDPTQPHTGKQAVKITNTTTPAIVATNLAPVPFYTGTNPSNEWQTALTATTLSFPAVNLLDRPVARCTANTGIATVIQVLQNWTTGTAAAARSNPNIPAGQTIWLSATVQVGGITNPCNAYLYGRDAPNNDIAAITFDPATPQTKIGAITPGVTTRVAWKVTVNAGRTLTSLGFRAISSQMSPGAWLDVTRIMISLPDPDHPNAPPTEDDYVDGDMPTSAGFIYRWSATPQASVSNKIALTAQDCHATAPLGTCSDLGLRTGSTVTAGVWVNVPSTVMINPDAPLMIGGSGVRQAAASAVTVRDQWSLITATTSVTDSTGDIWLRAYGGGFNADAIDYDDFSLALGTQPQDFNGDTPPTAGYSYGWAATPGNSASIRYMIAPDPAPLPVVWNPTFSTWQGQDGSAWDLNNQAGGVYLTNAGLIGLGGFQYDTYDTTAVSRPGQRHRGSHPQPRTVEWPIYLYSNESSVAWRALAGRWWRSFDRDRTGTWTITLDGGEKRHLDLRLSPDMADAGYTQDPYLFGWAQYTVELIADQPFWYGDPIRVGWLGDAPSVPFFDPNGSPPFHISGDNTTGATTVSNLGDEDVWPIITINGPAATPQIIINGGTVTPPSVDAGRVLTIDTSPLNPSAILDDGTDVFSQVSTWLPRPVPHNSVAIPITVSLDGTGSIQVTLTPLYERVY